MSALVLDLDNIRDISSDVLDRNGRMRILPAEYWAGTTMPERAAFGHRHGIYSFPTVELVDHLRVIIDGRDAIEIGAGNGVLAEALGIPGTDNRQHEIPKYREVYRLSGQPPVQYGPNIVNLDAASAIARYNPQVVIGCWITHRYDPTRHHLGGNEIGVDELATVGLVDTYVAIGNEYVHRDSRLWERPHLITYPSWLYSRSHSGTRNFVAVWGWKKDA